ncbi:hypothetical protein ACOME3_004983 [Neoechinorhynchus agilis]
MQYELSEKSMANSTTNPDNHCFDKFGSGLFDISKCLKKLHHSWFEYPIVVSNPYFYKANRHFASKFDGLQWNKPMLTSLQIEPRTGSLINGDFDLDGFLESDTIYPIVWFNQSFIAAEEHGRILSYMVQLSSNLIYYICLLFGCLSTFCVLSSIVGFITTSNINFPTCEETSDFANEESVQSLVADEHTPFLQNAGI